MVWKVVYETADRYHVAAVRVGVSPAFFAGESVAKLDIGRDFPWLDPASQQAQDIERFRWFSQGFVARDPVHYDRVIDVRYSLLPNKISALWSIRLAKDAAKDQHAVFQRHSSRSMDRFTSGWQFLTGAGKPLPRLVCRTYFKKSGTCSPNPRMGSFFPRSPAGFAAGRTGS